ncbi:helix-turn-helix transcriptional regulator [Vibrio vulnificus]|uniref:helix-turn-helix transcriptional regulator n=1 Tax=Vibrio vulnificus TaxID=672 RepID=UPI0009B705C8|nr:helix-turn-helix transcriptional regulator [Vibrio vulnificus]POC22675.1 LuxR family transcriptional regulator [Vibrio vulnificus]
MDLSVRISSSEYQKLSQCIATLRSPSFSSTLIAMLAEVVTFDCAIILGHRDNKHPIYLFDSIQTQRELLFQRYLLHYYQHDPLYDPVLGAAQQGVFHLAQVMKKDTSSTLVPHAIYQQEFYQQTQWQDEAAIIITLDEQRAIAIYLGVTQADNAFQTADINALSQRFDTIAALCRQHWLNADLLLAEPQTAQHDVSQWVRKAIGDFGQQQLSQREQEIAALLIQGLDSKEIAQQLGITLGTVKNHRKRIYAQLNVASLSELFQLFLNHLIALKA